MLREVKRLVALGLKLARGEAIGTPAVEGIGRPDVLRRLARETALDLARFEADYVGQAYEAVLRDCAEGAAWFGVSGLPTVT